MRRGDRVVALLVVASGCCSCQAFSLSSSRGPLSATSRSVRRLTKRPGTALSNAAAASASTPSTPTSDAVSPSAAEVASSDDDTPMTKQQQRMKQIREEGGPLAFNTKYGALNPYGIYYGIVSVGLGLVWLALLTMSSVFYKITGNRFDKRRRFPIFAGHLWGYALLALTGNFPKIENKEIIDEFHKSGRKGMFVSNHNSWMDIPFIGYAMGWINYKFVAKKELEKVPILGFSLSVAKHMMIDRADRKSQLLTLRQGMKYMDDGVNLVTFPEGTRSRSGRVMPFKNGAFKMAHKAGKPVVPVSICNAAKVMPSHWMMPFRPGRNICKVLVHEPIESSDKTEEELGNSVRQSIISGLPEEQRPLFHNEIKWPSDESA
mmetsp:Transcript_16553/g.37062  ORF Transcript_16553/g.37062 Transcript_16553/m.37062 type:complete len:376 (-) Transcript_16553:1331-2458(-)